MEVSSEVSYPAASLIAGKRSNPRSEGYFKSLSCDREFARRPGPTTNVSPQYRTFLVLQGRPIDLIPGPIAMNL